MRQVIALAVACVLASSVAPSAQQAGALQTAATTLGTATINTLQFTGSGANFSLGQNYTPAEAWPRVTVKSYTAVVNYEQGSMRADLVREMGETMPRGGGAPFFGEQRQTQIVSGNFAWNQVPAPPPGPREAGRVTVQEVATMTGTQVLPPQPVNQAAAAAQVERMLMVWSTPQGFVRAAMANNAVTKGGRNNTTDVSFTLPSGQKMAGVINAQGQVEKVQTWVYQSIVGDMLIETTYSGYKDFGGVTFPSRLVQTQDGFPTLDITIDAVTANPMVNLPVPANVMNAPAPAAPTVTSEALGDGLFYLTGGTHHSLAVAMRDHIVVVDLPNNQARAAAVLAKAKEVIPNKPVRFVVTSHHHWDHLGGIREAFAEGATIVTHESNKRFLERVAKAPHTLSPDRQAMVKGKARIQSVKEKAVLSDGTRVIELHRLAGYDHTGDMLVVYLPKEKILAEPDAFTPPAQAGAPLVRTAVPYAKALYDNIKRLNLDVTTIAPFHGNRKSYVAELGRAGGVANATN
jgi:glyoxylase-like metal-dependent hydrolase (beta-lactamase superfamily II)